MISVLVVGAAGPESEPPSSIEVLHAAGPEDAIEKLGRNRRIDAILIVASDAAAVSAAVAEDVLAPPPVFQPEDAAPLPRATVLAAPASDLPRLLELLAAELSS